MTKIQATREYQAELKQSLIKAKRRLSERDFAVMSSGILREIDRLDLEIENLRLKEFMGCGENVPLFPRVIQFVQHVRAKLETNESPTLSGGNVPYIGGQVTHFTLESEHIPSSKLSTISMNTAIAFGN